MNLRWLLAVPAAFILSGVAASADVLVMEDGRNLRGELISVSRGVITFDQERGTGYTRARRVRVRVEDVERIDFNDTDIFDDDADLDTGGLGGYVGTDRMRNSRTVTVPAGQQWIDTGINVRAGDSLRFEPQGVIQWGAGRQDGPAGEANSPYNGRRPMPGQAGGALIGRIGDDVFFIGSDTGLFRARTSGRLYLGVNDDYLQDNSGSFRVRVLH